MWEHRGAWQEEVCLLDQGSCVVHGVGPSMKGKAQAGSTADLMALCGLATLVLGAHLDNGSMFTLH